MTIAAFGTKVFEVNSDKIYTFDGLQYASSLQTEKQDAEGKKTSTYNKGSALDSMSFKIKLDVSIGVNPRREWEEWIEIKDAAVAYPFILGNKPLGQNKWLLVNVSASNTDIDNEGNILAMDLALQFDEWVRPGSASANKSGGSGTGSKKTTSIVDSLLDQDKSSKKRENQEMKYAMLHQGE